MKKYLYIIILLFGILFLTSCGSRKNCGCGFTADNTQTVIIPRANDMLVAEVE